MDEPLQFPAATLRRIIRTKIDSLTHAEGDDLDAEQRDASSRFMVEKDASLACSAATTVFVSYVTALAVQLASSRKRSTVTSDDILEALTKAEFSDIRNQVWDQLMLWRQESERKRARARSKDGVIIQEGQKDDEDDEALTKTAEEVVKDEDDDPPGV